MSTLERLEYVNLAKIGDFDLHWQNRTPCTFFLGFFHEKLILKTKLYCSLYIYIGVQNIFSRFSAFLRPNIEKLAFFFYFKLFMNTKWNANFSIFGPKNTEKWMKIFLHLFLVFKINFLWKCQEKVYRGFLFCQCRLNISSTLIWNAKHVLKVAF